MAEIEIGEYVRTKQGKIDRVQCEFNAKKWRSQNNYGELIVRCELDTILLKSIVKHSKQLIDLVELKDLVCFKNKLPNSLENEKMIIHIFDNDTLEEVKQAIEREEIELLEILTHEQFEQNSYKVGGEDE